MTTPSEQTDDGESLAALAAAVGERGTDAEPPPPTRVRPATAAERSAAGACDAPIMIFGTLMLGCFGTLLLDSRRAVSDWNVLAVFATGLLIFSILEPCGLRTPGQRILDLRVVRETGSPAGKAWARWTVKWPPALFLMLVSAVGALGFRPPGVSALAMAAIAIGGQVAYWWFNLRRFGRTGVAPVYDRVGRTRVVRAIRVGRALNDQGFAVLPSQPEPRPVLPLTLEGTEPAGYPPPAGHE